MSTVQHETGEKWFNSPVTRYEGLLPEVEALVPVFERLPFAVEQVSRGRHAANERLEMIVRKASGAGDAPLPVGIVSKEYALVQHREVVAAAGQSLLRAGIDPRSVRVALRMTQYGERMAVSFFMPEEYRYDPGDGRPMGLRLECVNSVDGSTRFRAMMGWFRFVCSNGLVIGTAHTDLRRRHSGAAHVSDMQRILEAGLKNARKETALFTKWRAEAVSQDAMLAWLSSDVRKAWGLKAATRVHHIATTGCDGVIEGSYKGKTPATLEMTPTVPVPGSEEGARNLYDLAQILAWLAKERRDVQEQIEWREMIPGLIGRLVRRISSKAEFR